MRRLILAVVTGGLCGAIALGGSGAMGDTGGAQAKRASSTVTMGYQPDPSMFFGDVSSGKVKCVMERRVRILEQQDGQPVRVVGEDTTNENGVYSLVEDDLNTPAAYVAKALKKKVGPRGNRKTCQPAFSESIIIE